MLSRESMYFTWPVILFFLIGWPIAGYITFATFPNSSIVAVSAKILVFCAPTLLSALQLLRKLNIIHK